MPIARRLRHALRFARILLHDDVLEVRNRDAECLQLRERHRRDERIVTAARVVVFARADLAQVVDDNRVIAGAGRDGVRARARHDEAIAVAAEDRVVAGVTENGIAVARGENRIPACAATNHVVIAGADHQRVITRPTHNRGVARRARLHGIIAVEGDDAAVRIAIREHVRVRREHDDGRPSRTTFRAVAIRGHVRLRVFSTRRRARFAAFAAATRVAGAAAGIAASPCSARTASPCSARTASPCSARTAGTRSASARRPPVALHSLSEIELVEIERIEGVLIRIWREIELHGHRQIAVRARRAPKQRPAID